MSLSLGPASGVFYDLNVGPARVIVIPSCEKGGSLRIFAWGASAVSVTRERGGKLRILVYS